MAILITTFVSFWLGFIACAFFTSGKVNDLEREARN